MDYKQKLDNEIDTTKYFIYKNIIENNPGIMTYTMHINIESFIKSIKNEFKKDNIIDKNLKVLNFNNPNNNIYRCNPLSRRYLKTEKDIDFIVDVITNNTDGPISKNDYFYFEFKSILKLSILLLQNVSNIINKDICSFPHLFILVNEPYMNLISMFNSLEITDIDLKKVLFDWNEKINHPDPDKDIQNQNLISIETYFNIIKFKFSSLISHDIFWNLSKDDINFNLNENSNDIIFIDHVGYSTGNDFSIFKASIMETILRSVSKEKIDSKYFLSYNIVDNTYIETLNNDFNIEDPEVYHKRLKNHPQHQNFIIDIINKEITNFKYDSLNKPDIDYNNFIDQIESNEILNHKSKSNINNITTEITENKITKEVLENNYNSIVLDIKSIYKYTINNNLQESKK